MIRFDRVSKRYPRGRQALSDVSFALAAGEMAFITGHSGAGKSTLLKLIAMVEQPDRGLVTMEGVNLGRARGAQVAALRRRIGMVFQDHRLLMDRSVAHNVELPLVIAGLPPAERGKRLRAALQQVGLAHCEKQRPDQLSTGEQQRVGVARAIVVRPDVLIADEPTGNLDPDLSREIMALFARFTEHGTTVLVATHDLPLLKRMRQRTLVLDQGRLVDDVPQAEVA